MANEDRAATVSVVVQDERAIVTVCGELDLDAAGDVEEAVARAARAGARHVEFDLDAVEFVDSAGLASVARASRRFESIRVAPASRQVRRLLELSNLTHLLRVDP